MEQQDREITTHRVITMLNRQEMEFLDKLGKDSLFSTGHKLSYNEILKALIEFAMELKLSGDKVCSLDAFKEKMYKALQDSLINIKKETLNAPHQSQESQKDKKEF